VFPKECRNDYYNHQVATFACQKPLELIETLVAFEELILPLVLVDDRVEEELFSSQNDDR